MGSARVCASVIWKAKSVVLGWHERSVVGGSKVQPAVYLSLRYKTAQGCTISCVHALVLCRFFVLFNLARLDSGRSYALSAEVTELGSPYKVW